MLLQASRSRCSFHLLSKQLCSSFSSNTPKPFPPSSSPNHPLWWSQKLFTVQLQECSKSKNITQGKLKHSEMFQVGAITSADTHMLNTLLYMYISCGSLRDAIHIFSLIPNKDSFSWNVMISAYAKQGHPRDALTMFAEMQNTNPIAHPFIYATAISASTSLKSLRDGMMIHGRVILGGLMENTCVGSSLIDMYGKCGNAKDGFRVFEGLPNKDIVVWTSMIDAFATNGKTLEALGIFGEMVSGGETPNVRTIVCVLPACAELRALKEGTQIHALAFYKGFHGYPFVQSGLIDMYAKCKRLDEAKTVFKNSVSRDVALWTVMISAYAHNELADSAIRAYQNMRGSGIRPNVTTYVSVLPAIADLAVLELGKDVHDEIVRRGLDGEVHLQNGLLNMYVKCGDMSMARKLFDEMRKPDTVSWTTMIAGYAMCGLAKESIEMFHLFAESGTKPDYVSFVCVLSACAHAGMVDEGFRYFKSMKEDYQIVPEMIHYSCMVDLLGRVGRLDEAYEFIKSMPVIPDAVVWRSLLGACRTHNNLEIGEVAASRLFELDSDNASPYVLLSNMYAASKRWEDILELRERMDAKGIQKPSGCSWIEIDGQLHAFKADEKSHPRKARMHEVSEDLSREKDRTEDWLDEVF